MVGKIVQDLWQGIDCMCILVATGGDDLCGIDRGIKRFPRRVNLGNDEIIRCRENTFKITQESACTAVGVRLVDCPDVPVRIRGTHSRQGCAELGGMVGVVVDNDHISRLLP